MAILLVRIILLLLYLANSQSYIMRVKVFVEKPSRSSVETKKDVHKGEHSWS